MAVKAVPRSEPVAEHGNLAGLSLRDLEYVVAVADLGNFMRAAERCHVTQPSLSVQIRRVETRLGTVIFERTTRKILVTEQGGRLVEQMRKILVEGHRLLDMALRPERAFGGTLRLSAIATLGPYYFPHVLGDIQKAFQEVSLELGEGKTDDLVHALLRGELDVVLMSAPVTDTQVSCVAIFQEPFRLACRDDHPVNQETGDLWASLKPRERLLLEEGHCLREQALAACDDVAADQRQGTSRETLRYMVAAGEGCTLMPQLATTQVQGMRYLPLPDDFARTIVLAWRKSDPRADDFRALARTLRAAEHPRLIS
jgi:LysR family transcriptional regulator, hydrogen peroxide-inducible genes activator